MTVVRELAPAETAHVSGGEWSNEALAADAAYGAALGATIGAALLGSAGNFLGVFYGAFVGGALGGAYYAVGELVDYCY